MNKVQEYLAGVNIAAADTTNKPSIDTDTRFKSGRLRLIQADLTNEISFVSPSSITASASVTFPNTLSSTIPNEIMFRNVVQEIENKTINATKNAITNLANSNISIAAAIEWNKISKVGSSLSHLSDMNLTGLTDNYSIKWDGLNLNWVVYDLAQATGETNTVSNLTGTTGAVGVYKQKTGMNFELKKLNAGSTSVTITDDTSNNEIDVNVVDATTALKGKVQLATSAQTTSGLVVQASDTRLSDDRTALAHADEHKSGGGDVIKVNELAAPTANITTANVTISANGLAPILPNLAQMFLNGVGNWSEPVGTASGVSGTGSIIRGIATKSGDGTTLVFTIAHGMSVTPTAYFVEPTTTDALGFFTKSVNSTNITITYQIAPRSGTSNLLFSWVVMDSGTGSVLGEANTYSSVGTGIPITKTKVGADLPFRSLFAGSNRISITQNANDASFDVNQGNLVIAYSQLNSVPAALVKTDQTNIFGVFAQSFPADQFRTYNTAGTFYSTLKSNATANRAVNLPDAAGTLVTETNTATLTGKTLTAPIISTISNTGTITLPTTTTTLVGRDTTDTMTNKTLTNPTIGTIKSGTFTYTVPTLTANDNAMGRNTTDTMTNKTINLTDNTLTNTGAILGDLPVHNGTKYIGTPKGPDGSFLGVSGGSLGYYTPTTGSGGLLPDGSALPSTGRWGALWGGSLSGNGMFGPIVTYNTITYILTSPTGSAVELYTTNVDDAIAEIKIPAILARQSNIKLKIRCAPKSSSGSVLQFGVASVAALPTGGSHDNPLNNASGVMITCSQDIESFWQVSRNSGGASQVKETTTIASNNTNVHTFEFDINTTNCIVSIDGVVVGTYTTSIPGLTTPLYIYAHVEAIGATARGIQVRYIQATSI